MALSHGVIVISVPLDLSKTSVSAFVITEKKSSNNFSMTYWLVVLLLPNSFIEVACVTTNYPGDRQY